MPHGRKLRTIKAKPCRSSGRSTANQIPTRGGVNEDAIDGEDAADAAGTTASALPTCFLLLFTLVKKASPTSAAVAIDTTTAQVIAERISSA